MLHFAIEAVYNGPLSASALQAKLDSEDCDVNAILDECSDIRPTVTPPPMTFGPDDMSLDDIMPTVTHPDRVLISMAELFNTTAEQSEIERDLLLLRPGKKGRKDPIWMIGYFDADGSWVTLARCYREKGAGLDNTQPVDDAWSKRTHTYADVMRYTAEWAECNLT